MKQYFLAIATLTGTIIGAGIFALPYVFSKVGFLTGLFLLLVVGAIILLNSWLYGEVILRTSGEHRLIGYAQHYLGKKGKIAATFSTVFGFYGSIITYLILGTSFLRIVFQPIFDHGEIFWAFVFFGFAALSILVGLRIVSAIEFVISFLLVAIALIFAFKGLPFVRFDGGFFLLDGHYQFLAYSVIFYSLLGSSALPEMRQILKGREKKFKTAIFWGIFIPVVVYALFAVSVAAVSGTNTTKEAILGLEPFFGRWAILLGSFFGFIAVFSSFIVIGLSLRKNFQFDYKINRYLAWFLVCFVPLAFYLAGIKDLLKIMGVVGIVMGGIEGVLLILLYKKADRQGDRRPEYDISVPTWVLWGLIFVFVFGMAYQLATL